MSRRGVFEPDSSVVVVELYDDSVLLQRLVVSRIPSVLPCAPMRSSKLLTSSRLVLA